MNHFSTECLSSKDSRDKVHFAEEAEVDDYDSAESLLMIEEISAIEGRGKKMASSIRYTVAHICHSKTYFCACHPH